MLESGAFVCVVMFAWISSVETLVTSRAEGRRYAVHAGLLCELLRQKNKYGQRRRAEERVC